MIRGDLIDFVKGHATQNDFVILPDLDNEISLSPQRVRWLCDRRQGIGADGILRVVRSRDVEEFRGMAGRAEFAMDYWNADGSLAEICGNGARLFVRYLVEAVTSGRVVEAIGTRGGVVGVQQRSSGEIALDMGPAHEISGFAKLEVCMDAGRRWFAKGVRITNPHAVVNVNNLEEVGSLALKPDVHPITAFPNGANIEFYQRLGPGHVKMRVYERGVGETRSCGSGACAVVWACAQDYPDDPSRVLVDVPGGSLSVEIGIDGHIILEGPATIVCSGGFRWPGGV